MLRTLPLPYSWAKSSNKKNYFTMKCWTSHVTYWRLLKVENRMAVWVQNDFKLTGCLPLWSWGWLALRLATLPSYPASWDSMVHIASPRTDQNSKFKVQVLLNAYCLSPLHSQKTRDGTIIKSGTISVIVAYYIP